MKSITTITLISLSLFASAQSNSCGRLDDSIMRIANTKPICVRSDSGVTYFSGSVEISVAFGFKSLRGTIKKGKRKRNQK